jgi:voltage-gated potassium channel Kch
MINLKRARYTLIAIVLVLYLSAIAITLYAGQSIQIAIIDNSLDALQVGYNLISLAAASNPLILTSKLLDALVLPILAAISAAWFFDFINSVNLGERIVLSKLKRMEDHVIIVPYNSFAKTLMKELKDAGFKVAVIAENKREMAQLRGQNELAFNGDIKLIETFDVAGIQKARCLIACSKDDVQNALITITAKTANPHIRIIARVTSEENISGLLTAGAKKVVIPERTVGIDIGNELTKVALEKKSFKKA